MSVSKIDVMRYFPYGILWIGILGIVLAEDPTPTPPPMTSVQIVNATSVPAISLSINGSNSYPEFPQGIFTSDAPMLLLETRYTVVDKKTSARLESEVVKFQANANQSLVIMGDFSTTTPSGTMPQPNQPPPQSAKPYPPNVVFQIYTHKPLSSDGSVRLRILNGMPGKTLIFSAGTDSHDILPGESIELSGQPVFFVYQAKIDDQQIDVIVRQSGIARDAMLIFFLKEGKPTFMRAFQNTAQPHLEVEEP